jgi:hypothetical protein
VIKLTIFGCEFLRGHYKCFQCLSQLVGVAAHLKHSAQPPTMGQSFIMTLYIFLHVLRSLLLIIIDVKF